MKGVPRHSINGIPNKYKRMADLYRFFARSWVHMLDFSDQALIDAYNYETYGTLVDKKLNGYIVGKQYLGVNLAMWKEDIADGQLFKFELYEDPELLEFHWWLDRVL